MKPSWSFLAHFRAPHGRLGQQWDAVVAWVASARGALIASEAELAESVERSDRALAGFERDPVHHDWSRFRPLRLSREEDWSDWLAHLLETSQTGTLAQHLFGAEFPEDPGFVGAKAEREIATEDDRRADLVIRWARGAMSHVEVKVGDENFDKTFATSRGVALKYPSATTISNHVLVPPWSRAAWDHCAAENVNSEPRIGAFEWTDVAIGLRRALRSSEPLHWRAWAWSFCGCIEQRLLVLHLKDSAASPVARLAVVSHLLRIVRGAEDA